MSILLPGIEHTAVTALRGPLLVVGDVESVGWDEWAVVGIDGRPARHGLVLEVDRNLAVLQVLEGTQGLGPGGLRIRFEGRPLQIRVGPEWLGRVANGRGEPIDGGPPVLGRRIAAVNGWPLNPVHRRPPSDPVITGVSAIDALNTLVRGQKLPVFSVAGLPHLHLATQIAAQAGAGDPHRHHDLATGAGPAPGSSAEPGPEDAEGPGPEGFCVVFAGLGLTHAEFAFVRDALEERSAAGDLVMVLTTADDPVIERILTPRIALTIAEDLAFTEGRDVLVVMSDLTSYCEAVREVSAARREIPARRAYPGYLYSDLASLYERCGIVTGCPGSLTQVPVLTMPAGDITHPVPDLTGYITEGQIVLDPHVHARGVYPPVDVLSSLSRLMRKGAGPGRTREDHLDVAAQALASAARARQAGELAELVGVDALSETDHRYLRYQADLERRVLHQGPDENRSLERTLDLLWAALALLPRRELTMTPTHLIDTYLPTPAEEAAP